jgi:hypothetical protein
MERLMQPTTNLGSTSYSDLPIVCTNGICTHLAATGSVPLVRVRSVNQDFFQESRLPLAEAVIKELKEVNSKNFPDEAARLRAFKKYLGYVKSTNRLPDKLREAILKELCRIVNTLPNRFFHAGWRDMVAQFNAESEVMRTALKPDMNKACGRVELYGDGGTPFHFDKPLQWGA